MDRERVGRRIKAFRKLKGYTQAAFAKKLNLPISTLGKIERAEREALPEQLEQIASHLQIPSKELINNAKEEREK
ncbi:helix-turn-helix transcriptional regulator [Lentibacillus cibarius]|uniref:Helix-turn-helix transcriptional regulator n=1 Tax=Lentibacillus cibarius TaxID=2583219 RepID=A0A549YGY1_9BACI|nr:helix-turn-helix transcriptional regulator [Lentibacillus cibarius]TRM11139.1 helix-turn-helix transcriptional regulator [Lentibacillus cibarius]